MKLNLEFVQLHTPLFFGGVNFGEKLYPKQAKGSLEMWYDTDLRHTFIVFKSKVAMIESTASMTLKDATQVGLAFGNTADLSPSQLERISHPMTANVSQKAQIGGPASPFTAQVETPQTKTIRRPGRPARYQGEEPAGD